MKKICPICQMNNNCQIDGKERCWCMDMTIPKFVSLTLQKENIANMCICQKCLESLYGA